jgi:hypothetical protein
VIEAYRDSNIVQREHEEHRSRFDARLSSPETAHATGQAIGRLLFIGSSGYQRDRVSAVEEVTHYTDTTPRQIVEAERPPELIAKQHAEHIQRFETQRDKSSAHLGHTAAGEVILIRLSPEDVEAKLIDDEPAFDLYERVLAELNKLDTKEDRSAMRYIDIFANNSLANATSDSEAEKILAAIGEYIRLHDELHDTYVTA